MILRAKFGWIVSMFDAFIHPFRQWLLKVRTFREMNKVLYKLIFQNI